MRRATRWGLAGLGSLVALIALGYAAIHALSQRRIDRIYPVPALTLALPTDAASIAEGRRLAIVRGCMHGCHGHDGEGGIVFDDPKIARIVAPSLSAAARKYDTSGLAAIIRNGVRPDGRSLVVMPSEAFVALNDDDLAKIIAFLKSLPAANEVQAASTFGPLGRLGIVTGKFRVAADIIAESVPLPESIDDPDGRGRYLARSICAGCHGPDLAGTSNPMFKAPDLVGVVGYTELSFDTLMSKGLAPGGRSLGMMTIAARDNLSAMNAGEVSALYVYLRGLGEARAMRLARNR